MADLTCEHLVYPGVFCGNPATVLAGESNETPVCSVHEPLWPVPPYNLTDAGIEGFVRAGEALATRELGFVPCPGDHADLAQCEDFLGVPCSLCASGDGPRCPDCGATV